MIKKALLVFIVIIAMILSSCALRSIISTDEMLSELLLISGEPIEDNGYVFYSFSQEDEVEYFSDERKILLYGEKSLGAYFTKIEECAIFLSARTVGELAVFKCYSSSDTDSVVKMCLERADTLKVTLRGSEWEEKSKNINVCVSGRYVLFCLCENAEGVEKAFIGLT